jgi:hypothetical protein
MTTQILDIFLKKPNLLSPSVPPSEEKVNNELPDKTLKAKNTDNPAPSVHYKPQNTNRKQDIKHPIRDRSTTPEHSESHPFPIKPHKHVIFKPSKKKIQTNYNEDPLKDFENAATDLGKSSWALLVTFFVCLSLLPSLITHTSGNTLCLMKYYGSSVKNAVSKRMNSVRHTVTSPFRRMRTMTAYACLAFGLLLIFPEQLRIVFGCVR